MKSHITLPFLLLTLFCFSTCDKESDPIPGSTVCTNSTTEQQIIDELNNSYAHPFAGAQPGVPDPSLNPLIEFLGEASFVGLGEATHGTSEFYKMKDQLFRLLVRDKDFKSIVFELPWGNAWLINEFVTQGKSTVDSVINQSGYWTYDTQEVRDLAQWVHDYNLSQPEEEKVFFVGCDPQGTDFSVERNLISSYLLKVQPDSAVNLFKNYNNLPRGDLFDYVNADESTKQLNILGTQKVYDHFVNNRDLFINASSDLEYEIALMATHVIQHREYIYRIGDSGVPRDSLMALYSEWWQRILGDNAKVAIWAHNFHVMDAAINNSNWMGTFLRQRHGTNYKNVAFSFTTGSFNAFQANRNTGPSGPVGRQSIPEEVCKTTNQLLSQVDGDQHFLILKDLDGESRQYFSTAHSFYQFGAGFNLDYLSSNYTQPQRLSRLFDVLIHFDKTSASDMR